MFCQLGMHETARKLRTVGPVPAQYLSITVGARQSLFNCTVQTVQL
ncbi:hypothetical protein SAMN04489752_3493 [Brevibacterium siliguriense]|uniref:Uncharacterized protein n=1 Tax=Brevibacterium siliguriense TaxID=1136497 RepID=A0A1H1XZI0_9MICO|nr:hypothetical protein SAMN04489752_3493 [Brevibacterium siliguriense]